MTDQTSERTLLQLARRETWYRYRESIGGFEVIVYLQRGGSAQGGCYLMSNAYGSDDGGDAGYYDSVVITYDEEETEAIIVPEMPGADVNILPCQMVHTATFKDWTIQRDFAYPDVRSWLDPLVASETGDREATVGPYLLYSTVDKSGDAPGGSEVGYFPQWMRCSSDALALCRRRAEASMNRHRVARLNSSDGSFRHLDHQHTLVRIGYEIDSNGSSYSYSSVAVPTEYRNVPDGSCSYEHDLLNEWYSYDGQHTQRALYYWEPLHDVDPRYPDIGNILLGDITAKWKDSVSSDEVLGEHANTSYTSLAGWHSYAAFDPAGRGAPGLGLAFIGREFGHSMRVVGKFGSETLKAYWRDWINTYFRMDEEVATGARGILGYFPEGWTAYGVDERDSWSSSLGPTATPPNPAYMRGRESQFIGLNLALLGCTEAAASFAADCEPWPLIGARLDDPTQGTTFSDFDFDGYPTSFNAYGNYLALWYSLASGNYHEENTAGNPYGGEYTDAAAVYAEGITNGLADSLLSQCPATMWRSAV